MHAYIITVENPCNFKWINVCVCVYIYTVILLSIPNKGKNGIRIKILEMLKRKYQIYSTFLPVRDIDAPASFSY